jgi:hypothetical protein
MTQHTVRIKQGQYRNADVSGRTFRLAEGYKFTAKGTYVTVYNDESFPGMPEKLRVKINEISDYEFVTGDEMTAEVRQFPKRSNRKCQTKSVSNRFASVLTS